MSKLLVLVTIECGDNDPRGPRLRHDITAAFESAIEWGLSEGHYCDPYPGLVCSDVKFSTEE